MTLERKIAEAFGMSDEVWARHANPWSAWTRFTVLPLLILALWSRAWISWWSLVPIAVALAWMWLNPRVFRKPRSTNNWTSKGVFGERVWLNRDKIPVPDHHLRVPTILNVVTSLGAVFIIWGTVAFEIWPTVFGTATLYLGKLWFVDRMVWLYEDMKESHPTYAHWQY